MALSTSKCNHLTTLHFKGLMTKLNCRKCKVILVVWVDQVKELGAVMETCLCVAEDMAKIFDVYWHLGVPHTAIPPSWPAKYDTSSNKKTPMKVLLNATESFVYLSVRFCVHQ